MVKLKSFLTVVIIAFFLVIVLTLAPSAEAGKLSGDTVKIGGIYSVSGVCAEWGTAAKISAEIAVEEINAAGGIGGVPIEMVWYDVGCKAPPAIPVIEKLAKRDKALVVNGPCQSSVCEVIFPKLNRLEMPMISFCSSKPGLSALSPWAFRNTLTSDKQLDPTVTKWKEKYGIKSAVILYNSEDAVSTVEGKKIMPVLFKKHGIELKKMFTFQFETRE